MELNGVLQHVKLTSTFLRYASNYPLYSATANETLLLKS